MLQVGLDSWIKFLFLMLKDSWYFCMYHFFLIFYYFFENVTGACPHFSWKSCEKGDFLFQLAIN